MSRLCRWTQLSLSLLALAGLVVVTGCQPAPASKSQRKAKPPVVDQAAPKVEAKAESKAAAKAEDKKETAKEAKKAESVKIEEMELAPPLPPANKPQAKPEEKKPVEAKPAEKKPEVKPGEKKAETTEAAGAKPLKKAELLVELPDYCNTPDGMTVLPDQSVIVSVPNFNDQKAPPLLVKITKDNKVEDFYKLPPNPETGRMGPMGIRVAPSGNLFLADNQIFHGKDGKPLMGKSRLVRIVVKDGKPEKLVTVASPLNVANGLTIHGGYVYMTETVLVPGSKPLVSGVFRFKLDEENVQMQTPLEKDPHLVLKIESSGDIGFGADGLCFDKSGNLYVNCFEAGVIRKVKLDDAGKVVSNEVFAQAPFMRSTDGMDYDPRTDKIYVADLMANAVRVISMDGKVETLAVNGDTDGSGGLLDAPCEALVRGNTIVVANMDFVVPGNDKVKGSVDTKFDKPTHLGPKSD